MVLNKLKTTACTTAEIITIKVLNIKSGRPFIPNPANAVKSISSAKILLLKRRERLTGLINSETICIKNIKSGNIMDKASPPRALRAADD